MLKTFSLKHFPPLVWFKWKGSREHPIL